MMKTKECIKNAYMYNGFVYNILHPFKRVYDLFRHHTISDKRFLERKFLKLKGYPLNLNNPTTINEKIQWLKLYDRKDWYTDCVDKYKVREYVKKKIGEEYLIPLVFQTKNVRDLCAENMPDYPVIIKTNHNSGSYWIIKDKDKEDWKRIRCYFNYYLHQNFFWANREWPYKNVERRIIVEKLMIDECGKFLTDIKFHCFHGKAEVIFYSQMGEDGQKKYAACNRNLIPLGKEYTWGYNKEKFIPNPCKPANFEKMLEIAEVLSQDFIHMRVDLYDFKNTIYFGELTFYDGGGFQKITPEEWDKELGDKIVLN